MTSIEVTLSESSIKNGRIYFARSDEQFFPPDTLSNRSADHAGTGTVKFIAGPFIIETTIREKSSLLISPRKTFAPYLKAVRAEAGDRLRVERRSPREYVVEYLGGS